MDTAPTRFLIDSNRPRGKFRTFTLVAGGRYLVALKLSIIMLWDIGVVGCKLDPPFRVAEVDCHIALDKGPWIDAESNGDDLFVRVGGADVTGSVFGQVF
jgi:hypothetical protein